jgi:predicted anti-sigma-YlaC factor YlaD
MNSNNNRMNLNCEEIQDNLMDYLTRDLGEARSDLIREHLRKCKACQAEARELQHTLDLLRGASPSREIPSRMSPKARKRMMRAVTHPVLDWIYRHHISVSLCMALIVVIVLLMALKDIRLWRRTDWDRLVPVFIGHEEDKEPVEPENQ